MFLVGCVVVACIAVFVWRWWKHRFIVGATLAATGAASTSATDIQMKHIEEGCVIDHGDDEHWDDWGTVSAKQDTNGIVNRIEEDSVEPDYFGDMVPKLMRPSMYDPKTVLKSHEGNGGNSINSGAMASSRLAVDTIILNNELGELGDDDDDCGGGWEAGVDDLSIDDLQAATAYDRKMSSEQRRMERLHRQQDMAAKRKATGANLPRKLGSRQPMTYLSH